MDLRRLRAGEWIAGVAGLVLLVALFLPWYGDEAGSRTGWQSLGALDVVLAIATGGLIAMRDERLTRGERHTDLTGVPIPAQPEIETLRAPRPQGGP